MLKMLRRYRASIWCVPLIAVIAGFFYAPLYVRIVVKFGVTAPGVIDDGVSLMASAGILLAVVVLGGVLLLRRRSRKEILFSAAIVSIYGLLLSLLQLLFGITTGPVAVVFMHLSKPLEWTGFFLELFLYLQNHFGVSLSIIPWLRFFAPLLFALFGRNKSSETV